jgi:hypothetical protein
VNELEDMAKGIDKHMQEMWTETANPSFTGKSLVVGFHDDVSKPWVEAAQSIRQFGFAKTDDEKRLATQTAIRNVIVTVNKAQRHAWIAHNVLEGLKRGDSPKTIAQNMEWAGIVEPGTLTPEFAQTQNEQGTREAAHGLARSSKWITSRAGRVVLFMAEALDRILASVATLIRIKPRVGVSLGLVPALDVSWELGDTSVKELVDAMVKGFD